MSFLVKTSSPVLAGIGHVKNLLVFALIKKNRTFCLSVLQFVGIQYRLISRNNYLFSAYFLYIIMADKPTSKFLFLFRSDLNHLMFRIHFIEN